MQQSSVIFAVLRETEREREFNFSDLLVPFSFREREREREREFSRNFVICAKFFFYCAVSYKLNAIVESIE